MAFLKSGDDVLLPENAYGPGAVFAVTELSKWNITHQFYDPMNPQDLQAKLTPRTRLVWLFLIAAVSLISKIKLS